MIDTRGAILYKTDICDPLHAPINQSITTVVWNQTLNSLTGTMSCAQGYSLNGTANIACDNKGDR